MKRDIFSVIIKQYDDLKIKIIDQTLDIEELILFLNTICDSGKKIKDVEQRDRLNAISLEIGQKIFEISNKFPYIELQPYDETFDLMPRLDQIRKAVESFRGTKSDLEEIKNDLDKIQKATQNNELIREELESLRKIVQTIEIDKLGKSSSSDSQNESKGRDSMSEIDKLKFDLEIRKLSSDIEQIRKTIESSQNSRSEEVNKIRETLEKIKDDLKKVQQSAPNKERDEVLKNEFEPIRQDLESLKNRIQEIKAEIEKLAKTPPSDKNESERKDEMSSDIEKLRFELEMRRVFSDIEQLRKAIEASQSTKSDEINKIRESLDKIKGDMEKLQKSPSDKDQDALKKELENIKTELEKLKKAPSDKDNSDKKDDPAMKSELEQLRKILEGMQDSKMRESLEQTKKAVEASQNKIVEALEKIKESIEKKPASPAPSGPSPDMQALKESLEQIKKAMEASQSSKMMDVLEKIKEAVEKKPAPPPAPSGPSPDIQALKESVEQIRKAVEATQIEPLKTMNIIVLVICVLTFFGFIWIIAMSFSINKTVDDIKDDLFPRKGKKTSQVENDGKSKSTPSDIKSVKVNESLHIINGQAVVRLEKLTEKSVNIELTLPNMKIYKMDDMKVGNRMRFEYDSETYFLDLVRIGKDSAKLKVYKRTST